MVEELFKRCREEVKVVTDPNHGGANARHGERDALQRWAVTFDLREAFVRISATMTLMGQHTNLSMPLAIVSHWQKVKACATGPADMTTDTNGPYILSRPNSSQAVFKIRL